MSVLRTSRRVSRLLTVFGFVAVFAGGFVYYWTNTGGRIPGITDAAHYQISFRSADVKNLQEVGDVSIAGVVVGHVDREENQGDHALVVLDLDTTATPLHQGATVRIGMKSVVGQSYVDVVDGSGAPIPGGTTLPDSAVKPAVDIDEVIGTFDPQTRAALSSSLRSLGAATDGTSQDTSRLMAGLGDLGRQGHTALEALAAQSQDLAALTAETTTLMDTLDTGRGQIADVVRDADQLTSATAGQRAAIENTMRGMPGLLTAARTATGKVGELSGSLAPVAADLNRAAPDLNQALLQLPPVTADLRGMLPSLSDVLNAAPDTLDRVPTFGADVRTLLPGAQAMLRDVNPMLTYLQPYGRDIGAMFANFGASMDVVDPNGVRPLRLSPVIDSGSVKGIPLPLALDPLHWNNAYPHPGQAGNPAPFTGPYPHVGREGN